MAERCEVHLPEIGDFHDVDVVELLVSVGQRVEKEQSLLVLESDKATMEIPAPAAGVILELRVRVGDQVNEGDLIAVIQTDAGASRPETEAAAPGPEAAAGAPARTVPRPAAEPPRAARAPAAPEPEQEAE